MYVPAPQQWIARLQAWIEKYGNFPRASLPRNQKIKFNSEEKQISCWLSTMQQMQQKGCLPQVLAEGLLSCRLMPAHLQMWERKQGRKWLVASAGSRAISERWSCLGDVGDVALLAKSARGIGELLSRRWLKQRKAYRRRGSDLQGVGLPPPPSALVYLARRAARKYHTGRRPRSKAVSNEKVFIYTHGKVWLCSGKMPLHSVWCKSAVEESMHTDRGGRSTRCKQCHRKTIGSFYSRYALPNADICRCQNRVSAPCQAGHWQIR